MRNEIDGKDYIDKSELAIYNSLADRRNKAASEYRQAMKDFDTMNKLILGKYGYPEHIWFIDYRCGAIEKYSDYPYMSKWSSKELDDD